MSINKQNKMKGYQTQKGSEVPNKKCYHDIPTAQHNLSKYKIKYRFLIDFTNF